MLNTAYIALGSNLNNPINQIKIAINSLAKIKDINLIKSSSFYNSPPLDNMHQPNYINAVVAIKTTLKPIELLDICQNIEDNQHRERTTKWAARTIDLDIILFANQVINSKRLTIPHYNMHLRDFVLIPLLEIEPDLVLPNKTKVYNLIKNLKSTIEKCHNI